MAGILISSHLLCMQVPHWENRLAFTHGAAQLCLISFLQWSEVKFELRHLHMAL